MKKLKILFVAPLNRVDFYSYFSEFKEAEIHFLWHVDRSSEQDEPLPFFARSQYYWGDYLTPFALLKKVKPDRILFFEIIDLRQIALIAAARIKKIPTFYLEHGAAGDRDTAVRRWNQFRKRDKAKKLFRRILTRPKDIISSKLFYYSVSGKLRSTSGLRKYLVLPFKMIGALPNKVLSENRFEERLPHRAIIFNQANFEQFEAYTGMDRQNAVMTGVPFFDRYLHKTPADEGNYLVYIGHPFLEQGLQGWTSEHHERIGRMLGTFARTHKMRIYIKPHPLSSIERWRSYYTGNEFMEILEHGDHTGLYLHASLILGFSSSIITGLLCARRNVVLLAWHPEPGIFGADFSDTGLCHLSHSPEELWEKYKYWMNHNLAVENEANYRAFIRRFNYPFDGKATQRVFRAITTHEIS